MGSTRVTGGGAPALSLWYNHGIITPYHTPKHVIHQPKLKYPCSRQDFRGPLRFLLSTMRLIPQHCSNVLSFRSIRLLFFLSYLSMCFLSCLSYLYHRSCPPIYWNSGVHCTKSCGSVVLLIGHRYLCLEVSSASDRMLPFETTNATMSQKHHSKCLDLCHKVVIIGVMFTRCHSFWSTKIYYRETLTKIYYSTKKYWKDPKIFGQPERGKAGNVEVFPLPGPRAVACALAVKDDVSAKARRLGRGHCPIWMVIKSFWFIIHFSININQSTYNFMFHRIKINQEYHVAYNDNINHTESYCIIRTQDY